MRCLLTALLLLCASLPVCAEWRSLPPADHVSRLNDGVELQAGAARVRVTVAGRFGFRVRVAQNGTFAKDISWALDPAFKPQPPTIQISETGDSVTLQAPSGSARITFNPLRIAFLDAQNKVMSDDAEPMAFDGPRFQVTRTMPPEERYYGLGDKTSIVLNDRAFTLWNTDAFGWGEATDPLYKAIPFFIAMDHGHSYGIFMDNTWRSSFDFGKARHDAYSFGAEGGELNYYFYFGPDPKQVLTAYTTMTGRAPMPPLWSLGYQQSRYSYYPEAQVREIASTFRQHNIPLDVLYLDIDYQDRNRPFTIDRQRFPHFEQMVQDLRKQGISTVLITDLHIAKADYPPYNSGKQQDVFLHNPDGSEYSGVVWPGPAVFPDFTLTKARDWWGGLYADFVKDGVRGFWNDMNEPSVFQVVSKTMPLDLPHRLDDGTTLPHLGAHNILGQQNTRGTWEGLLKLESPQNERPFVLTRASYSGGQRFSATWTGDNTATWNHMRMSLPTLMNLGLAGFSMAGDDIGGFHGTAPPDLVTRWMWLGVFNPIFRNHAEKGSGNKEPWVFGPRYELMMKAAIEQRYRMLPYIYSQAEESSRTGMPMMRPLFLEFPQDEWLAGNEEEFVFGSALLVAPRVWEFNEPYAVHLPGGTWFDYWTGKKYVSELKSSDSFTAAPESEGASLEVNPALDQVPVYVKAGSIIAHQPVVQSTAFTPRGNLELRVYPGPDCHAVLYLDDGHSLQPGANHMHLPMACKQDAGVSSLTIEPQHGQWKPWWSQIDIVFYGTDSAPTHVSVNGNAVTNIRFDEQQHATRMTVPYINTGETIELR